MNFKVEWDFMISDFFKYGSEIEYIGEKVSFKNEILYPGASIIKWNSSLNYQVGRTLLQLPLLKKGGKYHLNLKANLFPENSVMIQVDFWSKSGKVIETIFLDSKGGDFTYNLKSYSYSISLISAGLNQMIFEGIVLSDG